MEEATPRYTAKVYHSQLKPITMWPGIPLHLGIIFLMASMLLLSLVSLVWLFLLWRVVVIEAIAYLGVALFVVGDHHRPTIIVRHLSYPACLE